MVGQATVSSRASTTIDFAMPVALPPHAIYPAAIQSSGGAIRQRMLEIDDGQVRIAPPVPSRAGDRLKVEVRGPRAG